MTENLVLFNNTKAQLVISNARKDWFPDASYSSVMSFENHKSMKPKKTSRVIKNQIECRFIFLPLHLRNLTTGFLSNEYLIESYRLISSRKHFIKWFFLNIRCSEIIVIELDDFQETFLKKEIKMFYYFLLTLFFVKNQFFFHKINHFFIRS